MSEIPERANGDVGEIPDAPGGNQIVIGKLATIEEIAAAAAGYPGFQREFWNMRAALELLENQFRVSSCDEEFQLGSGGNDDFGIAKCAENHRSESTWRLTQDCAYVRTGLRRAGFNGGWLDRRRRPPS